MMAVNCQEDFNQANPQLSPEDRTASEWLGGYQRNTRSKEICNTWSLPPAAPLADGPISSDTPALILAGSYDPVTPPEWGKTTAEALPNSTYIEFGAAGHEVTMNNSCAQQMVVEFIRSPGRKVDNSCMANQPGPSFVTPADLYMAPGIYHSVNDVELGSPRGIAWLEGISSAALAIQSGAILALLVGGLVWLGKRRGGAGKVSTSAVSAYFLAIATAIIVLALPFFLTMVNNHNLIIDDDVVRTFGAGRDFLPASLLAAGSPILLILILALAAMVLWAWIKGKWSIQLRLIVTVVVLAALPMIYLGFRWDLYMMLL
jgi:hypothetical protein